MSSWHSLPEGTVIGGDFVVRRMLGSGGMGAVYLAVQTSTGKSRALKVMHRDVAPSPDLQRRFEQEAKVGARIRSGHVVEVVAAGVDAALGVPYLVMELLDGVDLRAHLAARGALPVDEVRRLFEQLCHGVGAAHDAGIVHRDLKPENIFLARPNQAGESGSVVKVLDFGIAKLASEAGTSATAAMGSPLWMAPEQTAPGPVTAAADVWSLGLIAFECLAGQHFWRAAGIPGSTPMHVMREILVAPIPPASERGGARLPAGFDAWFARCVTREPAERFTNGSEAWAAMEFMLGPSTHGRQRSFRPAPPDPESLAATMSAEVETLKVHPDRRQGETPVAVVASVEAVAPATRPSASVSSSRMSLATLAVGALIGVVGLAGGFVIARRPAPTPVVVSVVSPSPPPPPLPSTPTSPAPPPAAPPASVVAAPPSPDPPAHSAAARPSRAQSPTSTEHVGGSAATEDGYPPPRPALRDGFGDPYDRASLSAGNTAPHLWKVQGHHVRMFTRLLSNASNVTDVTVRGAIEWSSWEYLRCFERAFGAAKDLPNGIVTVAFDVKDQLPQHAALQSSTFSSGAMETCVVGTLAGHTMNAAGEEGAGHVVYAFKFVVVD